MHSITVNSESNFLAISRPSSKDFLVCVGVIIATATLRNGIYFIIIFYIVLFRGNCINCPVRNYVMIFVRVLTRPIEIDEQRKPALNARGSPRNGGLVLFFR